MSSIHLKALADRCETDPAACKTLGDQIGQLAVPPTVSGTELLEISKLGIRRITTFLTGEKQCTGQQS